MNVQISAIICTLNRADYLRKAIQSLVEQTLNKDLFEIIVVDNNSTDNTQEVVKKEFGTVTNLHYLFEPILGLSQARNTGWKNAKGKYIAYLDDDAIANPSWLEQIIQAFETIEPQPGCVGGKVEAIWEAPRPDWLSDELLPFLTVLDWTESPTTLDRKQFIAGANMAFPRHLLSALSGFNTDLGRKGKKLLSNEELLLRNQIHDKGYSVYYDPAIAVKHHVAASRLEKNWFLKRNYWQGISEASILLYQQSPSITKLGKLGILTIQKLIVPPNRLFYLLSSTCDSIQFREKCFLIKQMGFLVGLFRLAR